MVRYVAHAALLIFSLFVTCCGTAFAQSTTNNNTINYSNTDSLKVLNLLNDAYTDFSKKNYKTSFAAVEQCLEISNLQGFELLKAEANQLHGDLFFSTQNYNEAGKSYLKAQRIYERLSHSDGVYLSSLRLANLYKSLNSESKANEYLNTALKFSPSEANSIELRQKRADNYLTLGKFELAIADFDICIQFFDLKSRTVEAANALMMRSNAEQLNNQTGKALESANQALVLYTEAGKLYAISACLNNIGYLYFLQKNYANAIDAFKKVLTIDNSDAQNQTIRTEAMLNLAVCYQNMKETAKATEYMNKAFELSKSLADNAETSRIANVLALSYLFLNDKYNAEVHSIEAINFAKLAKNAERLRDAYETHSKILQASIDYEKALDYYKLYLNVRDSLVFEKRLAQQALEREQNRIATANENIKLEIADEENKDLAMKQMQLEADRKNRQLAFLEQESKVKDLEKQQIEQNLRLARQQHEAEIRERQISDLEKEKQIQAFQLKQKELEEQEAAKAIALLQSEKEVQELTIERQNQAKRMTQYMGILFSVIFIIILVALLATRRLNKKLASQKKEIEYKNTDLEQKNEEINAQKEFLVIANEEIQQKNNDLEQKAEEILAQNEEILKQTHIIEKKNEAITSSIVYAKRIQEAVLPPANLTTAFFAEQFIFFKPRDIVSGDFYWIKEKPNFIALAAADCTGHGVPGAFMSLLGISFLNDIIDKYEKPNAAEILNELRFRVKNALKQKGLGSEAKDGMDISFIIIDKETMEMQFAGAYNPLMLVQNNELIVLKADKMPIGVHIAEKESFTNHTVAINKGDCIYLMSDGFQDQTGGENGRKFMVKNLREILFENRNISSNQQKEALEKTFANWKGSNYEQVDDILIIGLKI